VLERIKRQCLDIAPAPRPDWLPLDVTSEPAAAS
jgi:hypothetical protein